MGQFGYIESDGSIVSITTDEDYSSDDSVETYSAASDDNNNDLSDSIGNSIGNSSSASFNEGETSNFMMPQIRASQYIHVENGLTKEEPCSIDIGHGVTKRSPTISPSSSPASASAPTTAPTTTPTTASSNNEKPGDPFQAYYDAYADQFLKFISSNPTTYHVIKHFGSLLEHNNFKYYSQAKPLKHLTPGFYYTTRADQTLVAFVIGGQWQPQHGSCFVGSHCDALSVKLNPRGSLHTNANGYELLGVAPYSGSLNDNWLNRDLGLAGSVLVRNSETGKVERKLINSAPSPIAVIPQFAPHFGLQGGHYNKQTQTVPIVSYNTQELTPTKEEKQSKFYKKHSLRLLRFISKQTGAPLDSIVDFDLDLVDVQQSCRGGLSNEFIFSPSLDDRLCAFDSIYGLIEFSQSFFLDNDISDYNGLAGVYLANNEEIGSLTSTGAHGGFLVDNLRSIVQAKANDITIEEAVARLITNTVFLSSDVTHAMNPNFKEVYLEHNFPLPNTGPSIKFDSNAHVLSDSFGKEFLDRIVANLQGIQLQQFHIRNDSRSGGTIGPIMASSKRGLNGAKLIIDVGLPILSMHSIRSVAGYKDVGMGVRFFKEVFGRWHEVIKGME
ncbi:vacuolar aminopeptidase 1 [Lodderomyces elongisporus]|uniref:vacuolar aminopeptidase 1 n=1 Tax=Lodderomyces elongisporus TaxID=36914 RepID=UPI00291E3CBE|nr:vacuolar aminopeptidase 1 [Lodderomyces elongisporus]WLF80728.1 vacuolar aminopeptidase 1 [Lodderomyces elongisporus]